MSLTGNLEDLPLLDILQIVSFSQKTGYLIIRHEEGDGAIVFRGGLVAAAFAWDSPPPGAGGETEIRKRIEVALARLARLREGQFNFNLTDVTPRNVAGRDVSGETLEPGLNAQELLIDLARGMDEDRRDSSAALEASFSDGELPEGDGDGVGEEQVAALGPEDTRPPAPAVDEERAPPPPAPETPDAVEAPGESGAPPAEPPVAPAEPEPDITSILLVEDEEDIRSYLVERLGEAGFDVWAAADPDAALKLAKKLGRSEARFALLTDLGMPTSGGSSFQGGFEVVKRLWKMNLRPPVLLMTETVNPALKARAKQMGAKALLFKPGLSRLDPEQFHADLKAFTDQLLSRTLPRVVSAQPTPAPESEKRRPLASMSAPEELSALQRRLRELREPSDASQISALVMKVAREFFERGILFLVKQDEVRGLGGFGPAGKGESLNLLVRQVTIPLAEPSIFREATKSRKPFHGALPEDRWNQHLMGRIGRFRSGEVALMPLVAYREPIAMLFGDNPETGRPLDRLEPLEIFITQAAIALENAFLQRKLEAIEQQS